MKNFSLLLFVLYAVLSISSCQKEPPPSLELSIKEVILTNVDGKGVIEVKSNGKWSVELSGSWFTATPMSGTGDGEIQISAPDNFGNEDKRVTLYVTSRDIKRSARLSQNYSRLEFVAHELSFSKDASSRTFYLTTNTKWQIEIPVGINWISASPLSGDQDREIKLTISANTEGARSADILFKYANTSKVMKITQERAVNSSPAASALKSPVNNLSNANRLPTFRWSASKDPDGDPVKYSIEYSKDQNNWSSSALSNDTVFNLNSYLDQNQLYYWRVKSADIDGAFTYSQTYSFITGTKRSYFDGEYKVAQVNTKGVNPSEILFIGDGYISEDYEEGGLFDKDIDEGIEHFFSIEPYKSYREYFKVYKQAGYSRDRGVTQTDKSITKSTKFGVVFKGGSSMESNSSAVFAHAKLINGVDDIKLRDILINLIVNENRYAGTCWTWSDGKTIAITPVSKSTNIGSQYGSILLHEGGGHGYGRLADEYVSSANSGKSISDDDKKKLQERFTKGYAANVDLTGDSTQVRWKHFILRDGYKGVGTFQGGYYYTFGVWRPEASSCMISNMRYFNAPSREAIVKRIMTTAGIEFSLGTFLEKDIVKSPSNAILLQTKSFNPLTFVPLAPPVMVE